MEFLGELKKEFIKGKSLNICGKIIYPIVRITIQKDINGDIILAGVNPIAVVIEEDSESHIIPLTDEEIDLEETVENIK
ncbi:MAG: hypothetical protein ACXVHT_05335 [Methanobacterium sp.]